MNLQRQTQAMAGHSFLQARHAARRARHRSGPVRRLAQRFVDVPSARQELGNPDTHARDQDRSADDQETDAEGHAGRQDRHAERQNQRRRGRAGHQRCGPPQRPQPGPRSAGLSAARLPFRRSSLSAQ
ncbi:MAG: hypothetical protein E6K70_13705 [Planctomycetota bacterium]|nr:MAG: hypothetical protein E6K70_13705 [Planctomycetota bacterium]